MSMKDIIFSMIAEKLEASSETDLEEKVTNPYAIGMAAAMKSTGDEPPLKKSTITKAHKIAKSIEKNEEVDLDEAKLSASQRDRLDDLILNVHTTTHPEYDGDERPQKYLKAIEKEFGAKIAKQVDDGSEQMHFGRDNQAFGHDKLASRQWSSKFRGGPRVTAAGKMNKQDVGALKTRIKNDKKFGGLLKSVKLPEEVKLDEISKKTLGSYVKKASKSADTHFDKAGMALAKAQDAGERASKSDTDRGYDYHKDREAKHYQAFNVNDRIHRKRAAGVDRAKDRLAEEVELDENAWEEVPMMMRQLQFIAYAAEEIMEYLDMGVDPEEWYQNKLASIHDQMQTLHAYAEGDKRVMSKMGYGMYDEAVNAKKIVADHDAGHSVDVIVQKHLNKKADNKDEILKVIRANAWNKRVKK